MNNESPTENGTPPGAETVSKESSSLEAAQTKAAEAEKKYLYLYAEFENFKKRAVKERQEAAQFGWEPVARDLLQVLDNLERALVHMPATTDPGLRAGIDMVAKQFLQTFEKRGVHVVPASGALFDASFHEAVGQDYSDQPAGHVFQVETKGYTLHGRLLRPARVLLSMGPRPASYDSQGTA